MATITTRVQREVIFTRPLEGATLIVEVEHWDPIAGIPITPVLFFRQESLTGRQHVGVGLSDLRAIVAAADAAEKQHTRSLRRSADVHAPHEEREL